MSWTFAALLLHPKKRAARLGRSGPIGPVTTDRIFLIESQASFFLQPGRSTPGRLAPVPEESPVTMRARWTRTTWRADWHGEQGNRKPPPPTKWTGWCIRSWPSFGGESGRPCPDWGHFSPGIIPGSSSRRRRTPASASDDGSRADYKRRDRADRFEVPGEGRRGRDRRPGAVSSRRARQC